MNRSLIVIYNCLSAGAARQGNDERPPAKQSWCWGAIFDAANKATLKLDKELHLMMV
ncbi:MAG: hypothetical protein ACLR2G_05375 [Phascolarctobacterium faecium]